MSTFYASYVGGNNHGGGGGGGVTSLNSLTGALTLVGTAPLTISPSGSNITISVQGTVGTVPFFDSGGNLTPNNTDLTFIPHGSGGAELQISSSTNPNGGGKLLLSGSTSGYTGFQSPDVGAGVFFVWPGTVGSPGQFLQTDGSTGVLSWATAGGGAPSDFIFTNSLASYWIGSAIPSLVLDSTLDTHVLFGSGDLPNTDTTNNSAYVILQSGAIQDTSSAQSSGEVDIITGDNEGTGATGTMLISTGSITNNANTNPSGSLSLVSGNSAGTANSGDIAISSGNVKNGGTGNTGALILQSGNVTSGTGVSGNVVLTVGSSTGTRGVIQLQPAVASVSGQVWTATDTSGSGHWATAGSSGANTALSNLATTAINANLTFDSTTSYTIASSGADGGGNGRSLSLQASNTSNNGGHINIMAGDGTNGGGHILLQAGQKNGNTRYQIFASTNSLQLANDVGSNPPQLVMANGGNTQAFSQDFNGGSSYTIHWPGSQGSANTYLKNDGSGNLSWGSGASGTFTTVDSKTVTVVNGIITSIV